MDDLKPCPFCGSEAKMHAAFAHGVASRVGAYVECVSCGAWSKTQWGYGAQEKTAEAWNRRAERTCGVWRCYPSPEHITNFEAHEDDELWCEHCDIELDEDWSYCPNCGARVVEEE